jgi:phage replication initiation protein
MSSINPSFQASSSVGGQAVPVVDRHGLPSAEPQPPASNTGGIHSAERLSDRKVRMVAELMKREQSSPLAAFIDWFSFTVKSVSFDGLTDEEAVFNLSSHLEAVLGFGITSERPLGRFNYGRSYELGDGHGIICVGGNEDTILVSLNGYGCMFAKDGWESRLYDFFNLVKFESLNSRGEVVIWPRITRVDLARDFISGDYTVDKALSDFHEGLFSLEARMPGIEQRGNWIFPDGKGRSLYIGSRSSGKVLRAYEKGRQLGGGFSDLFPNWNRVELELHNKDRVVPWEVLLEPGRFLAGAYPALAFISEEQTRVKTKKSIAAVTYDAAVKTARHQFGKLVNFMYEVEGSLDTVFLKLLRPGVPKRLLPIESLIYYDDEPLGAT